MPTVDPTPQQATLVTPMAGVKGQGDGLSPSMSPVNPAASDKVNYFGIEVLDKVIWKDWKKGKEYTRNLVLKNLSVKTIKCKYSVPESRFFNTIYPKPLFLSAGSSFTLPITFRPLENTAYDDKIKFELKDGNKFEIPLKAVLPKTEISIPIDLDFKMCAVKDFFTISFDVYNTGDLDTTLQWEVYEPFVVEPVMADLRKNSSVKFTATFKPQAAKVYEVTAVCKFGPEFIFQRPTTFYGIGKFPHLLVSQPGAKAKTAPENLDTSVTSLPPSDPGALETEVNFGTVAVASTAGQWVDLHNLSAVQAPFRIERVVGMSRMDTVFHCTQTQGTVPPMSLMRIPINYTPHTVGTTSIDYFSVVSVGDISRSVIKCVGSSVGPAVELSTYVVNFGQLDMGRTGTRTLDIVNRSNLEAVYQFELDCEESVFKFESVSGVLKPNSTQTLVLRFSPTAPINFYRRISVLIHNQPPMYLDLLGTCHSESIKPAVLRHEHITRYNTHVERGLSFIAPEMLNDMLQSKRLEVDENDCLKAMSEDDKATLNPNPSMKDISAMDEYFNDGFHSDIRNVSPHTELDVNVLDFGNVTDLNSLLDKTVTIRNHTQGKISVQWTGNVSRPFSVMPETMDIPPLKTCSFRVTFTPTTPNKIYGSELECYVFYKSMRDYRLVEDISHCPPWCLTLKCLAHTFQPGNQTFLPRTALLPNVVVFPAINTGEAAYRTVIMGNTGKQPLLYDLRSSLALQGLVRSRCGTKEAKKEVFAVKPSQGILHSGYQIFTVRMTPTVVNNFSHDLKLRLNDNDKYDQMLHLCGSAEAAEVLLDNQGAMYFKPTCVGTQSTRTYGFKNVSRIPLRFQWVIDFNDKKVISVEPESGVIMPNQSMTQTWSFSPCDEKKYVLKPTLVAWGQGLSSTSSGGKKKKFSIRLVGEGSLGSLKVDASYLDFGDIVVGSSSSRRISLHNNSSCSLHYRLNIDTLEEISSSRASEGNSGLEFDVREGVLPARSKQYITATIRPLKRISYQYVISYQLVTPHGDVSHPAVQEQQHLMHLLATGVYPIMNVSDIRSLGSAVGVSKKALWNLFSIDNLNAYLDADPSSEELIYNIATRHRPENTKRPSSVMTRAILDFNFSAAPLGSDPCTVSINFDNIGTVPCEWVFMFPRDIQMELGYWTESGDCSKDELHDMKVMDNKLFSISPKKGVLAPGEAVTVTFSYQHTMAGTDRLPVLLKLAKGREIMLNFVGVTVEPTVPYIHFPSNKHSFNPVPVGEKISPKQVYELYNGGAVPVTYECDLTPLDIVRQENFDQPVFECLNPRGEIPPGRAAAIQWRFFPLEAKTYMVDIPIKVHNGDTALVTFTGIGYDKRIMGETMPLSDAPDMCGVPATQTATIPGQLGYLSMERLSFGNMPLFSQARRMVFITNKSQDRSIFFEWHVTSQSDTKFLNIYPVRGEIGPSQYKMCRVTFQACGVPSFYDLDLVCEIADLHQYTQYRDQLTGWEAERDRQMTEFCITEHDIDADLRTPSVVEILEPSPSGRLSRLEALAEGRPVTADGALSKYKTLPPIKQLSVDEERMMAQRKKKKLSQLWARPQPPKPFLLHLGVTARTHDIRQFQSNFPAEYCHFYIDRTLSQGPAAAAAAQEAVAAPAAIPCSLAESNVVASVLGNCLRGLLDDTYFIQAVQKVMEEPTPYFLQFTEQKPSSPWSSTPRDAEQEDEGEITTIENTANSSAMQFEPPLSGRPSALSGHKASVAPPSPRLDLMDESIVLPDSERSNKPVSSTLGLSSFRGATATHHDREAEREMLTKRALRLREMQNLKKLPEFGNTVEQVLENAVLNLMYEALGSEYSVVSRPRFIALGSRKPFTPGGPQ